MVYEDLTDDMNRKAYDLGVKVYRELREIYPDKSIEHLDMMMNTLCMALVCLFHQNVAKDNRAILIQVVYNILMNNC